MICKNCGADIPNDTVFCPVCGTSQDLVENNDTNKAATSYNSTPILVFGILSIAFGAILSIIFGAIAKSRAKRMLAETGMLDGKAKAGKIMGTIGFILGIISTVIYAIVIVSFIALIASGEAASEDFWSSFFEAMDVMILH